MGIDGDKYNALGHNEFDDSLYRREFLITDYSVNKSSITITFRMFPE